MSFIELAPGFFVAPQIKPAQVESAKAAGVTLIINNRPDREESGQPNGADIAEAARRAGLAYLAMPIGGAGVSDSDLDAFDAALKANKGATLAFCKSGTRSAVLRALALARAGHAPAALIAEAAEAGYNIAGIGPRLAALSRG